MTIHYSQYTQQYSKIQQTVQYTKDVKWGSHMIYHQCTASILMSRLLIHSTDHS